MHTLVVRSFTAVTVFTSALACSSMVEHREGQTQPHGPTVEHSAEQPQAAREEISSTMTLPTDGQPSIDTPDTSGSLTTGQEAGLEVPRGTEKTRASKEVFAEHLAVDGVHALPETQTTMPFTSGTLDSLGSPTGRSGGTESIGSRRVDGSASG